MNESKADPIAFARDRKRLRKPLRLRGRWRPPRDGLYIVANSEKGLGGFIRVTRQRSATAQESAIENQGLDIG